MEGAMTGVLEIIVMIAIPTVIAIGGLVIKNRYDIHRLQHFLRGTGVLDSSQGVIQRIRDRIDTVEEKQQRVDGKINNLLVELDDTRFDSIEEVERENWNDDYHTENTTDE